MTTPARHGRPWTMAELRRAAEAIARGVPAAEVAAEHGRTAMAIRSMLYRCGYGDRSRRDRRARGDRWQSYALVLQLRAEGKTWREAHRAVVRKFGYPSSLGALKQGCRSYRRALQRPSRDAG